MDYLTILLMVCGCTFMYRVAELEKRRGWMWAGVTLIMLLLASKLIESRFIVFVVGVVVSFLTMFLANIFCKK